MEFKGNEQLKRTGGSAPRESIPGSRGPLSPWAEQVYDLINKIDHSPQLEETKPGIDFAQAMARLLDLSTIQSRGQLVDVFDMLYEDITNHDFLTSVNEQGEEHIHMAHETSPSELGSLFKEFGRHLTQFPVPSFDKELLEKRNKLVEAFAERATQLTGN